MHQRSTLTVEIYCRVAERCTSSAIYCNGCRLGSSVVDVYYGWIEIRCDTSWQACGREIHYTSKSGKRGCGQSVNCAAAWNDVSRSRSDGQRKIWSRRSRNCCYERLIDVIARRICVVVSLIAGGVKSDWPRIDHRSGPIKGPTCTA